MKTWPTVYKMTNTGKIQEWSISAEEKDGVGIYTVVHGQQNGKKQTTSTKILKGKNVGRANETTVWEQTQAEAEAQWTKKQERNGYTTTIPTSKPVRPMLAKQYEDEKHKLDWSKVVVQPKYDGVRALAIVKNGQVTLMSRQGKPFKSCQHIRDALAHLPTMVLDGELYSDELHFQDIVGMVKREKTQDANVLKIKYHIYDVLNKENYQKRHEILFNLPVSDPIIKVETRPAASNDAVYKALTRFVTAGYEGAIVRDLRSNYKINGRSEGLLKLKTFMDEEFEIIDVFEGKGKFEGMGIFKCQTQEEKAFDVTPKCSEDSKREILKNRDKYIGQMLTVKFFEWTKDKIPRFPVGISVRGMKGKLEY